MVAGEIHLVEGRLETGRWGPVAAPTLALLHEGLGSIRLWRDFPAQLAAATGCGVFAYSRFGYGQSEPVALPRPLDYMQREARAVLPRVLDAAGIGSCVLVGHSDDGSIAAIHAGSFQDFRVQGLVLVPRPAGPTGTAGWGCPRRRALRVPAAMLASGQGKTASPRSFRRAP